MAYDQLSHAQAKCSGVFLFSFLDLYIVGEFLIKQFFQLVWI